VEPSNPLAATQRGMVEAEVPTRCPGGETRTRSRGDRRGGVDGAQAAILRSNRPRRNVPFPDGRKVLFLVRPARSPDPTSSRPTRSSRRVLVMRAASWPGRRSCRPAWPDRGPARDGRSAHKPLLHRVLVGCYRKKLATFRPSCRDLGSPPYFSHSPDRQRPLPLGVALARSCTTRVFDHRLSDRLFLINGPQKPHRHAGLAAMRAFRFPGKRLWMSPACRGHRESTSRISNRAPLP